MLKIKNLHYDKSWTKSNYCFDWRWIEFVISHKKRKKNSRMIIDVGLSSNNLLDAYLAE
jgi:hypothetical protein